MNKFLNYLLIVFNFINIISFSNKFILTGGPCCGKTSVIKELQKRVCQTCPEAYCELYKEFKTKNKLEYFLSHDINQRWLLLKKHEEQESKLDHSKPAFLDRSIPDVIFYGEHLKLNMPEDLIQKFESCKKDYSAVFFFEPLPKDLYYKTEVRYETWEEAMNIHQTLLEGYKKNGFNIIIVPFDSIENRTNFVLKNIKNYKAPEKFTTLRLEAHKIQEQNLDNLYLLLSNPKVGKTVIGGVHTLDKTKEVLNRLINRWSLYGYGSYMFHDKSGNFIGRAGLHPTHIEDKEEIVLSYALMPEHWNNGFATEMGQALVKIGFEQLGFESIVCFTQPTNKASQRVIEKSGFKYEKTILEKSGPYKDIELIFYRLTNNTKK